HVVLRAGGPGRPTAPTFPSGPWRAGSALGVLRRLARLLQAGLLALDDAGVAREVAGLLQRRTVVLGVDGVERAGDAQAQRAGLAGDAAAGDARDDVEAALDVDELEGRADE